MAAEWLANAFVTLTVGQALPIHDSDINSNNIAGSLDF